ncbi:hypothetical protein ACTHGU_01200 [Chitinophagaceae bacterium MMS25-I14]
MTRTESMASRHANTMSKIRHFKSNNPERLKAYLDRGWLTEDPAALDLLKEGDDQFIMNVADRIIREEKDNVFLNYCPKCHKLARTPYAKQCRCGHSWRS